MEYQRRFDVENAKFAFLHPVLQTHPPSTTTLQSIEQWEGHFEIEARGNCADVEE
jgi:hypothetical protein